MAFASGSSTGNDYTPRLSLTLASFFIFCIFFIFFSCISDWNLKCSISSPFFSSRALHFRWFFSPLLASLSFSVLYSRNNNIISSCMCLFCAPGSTDFSSSSSFLYLPVWQVWRGLRRGALLKCHQRVVNQSKVRIVSRPECLRYDPTSR